MQYFDWSEHHDAIVREAYDKRIRLAEVAERLGVTRSAIIGRARRLGLCKPCSIAYLEVAQQDWRKKQLKEIRAHIGKKGKDVWGVYAEGNELRASFPTKIEAIEWINDQPEGFSGLSLYLLEEKP